ncbi:MAG: hypothetical protein JNJ58_12655 [Chitinophagaceae bacterium]|nr:hypothetical protein [Chitinophagaceae bacterium]
MKITHLSLLLLIGLFSACKKQDLTQTRVGFYVLQPSYTSADEGGAYDLYIDDQYQGKLTVSAIETDDSTIMNFQILDAKKHIIEVKQGNTAVSSTYLQISQCKGASGTADMIQGYKNGASYKKMSGMAFATYAIFQ